jgi:hypothetical protein
VDEAGVIIVGHTRYKAAVHLGLETVPVHVATGLTPAQVKAYRIADNQTASIATWDKDLLPLELADLQGMDFDLDLLGFDADELAKYMPGNLREGLTDPDDVPAPPDAAVTQPGDLWILGEHRLLCGDSSMPENVDRLLDGARIQLVNTDPPYNVKVEPRSNNAIAAGLSSFTNTHHQGLDLARHPNKSKPTGKKLRAKDRPLANDFISDEEFDRLLHAWFGNMARVLDPGRSFYVWGGYANLGNYPPVLKASGMYFSQGIVWDKQHPVLTRKDFLGCFDRRRTSIASRTNSLLFPRWPMLTGARAIPAAGVPPAASQAASPPTVRPRWPTSRPAAPDGPLAPQRRNAPRGGVCRDDGAIPTAGASGRRPARGTPPSRPRTTWSWPGSSAGSGSRRTRAPSGTPAPRRSA